MTAGLRAAGAWLFALVFQVVFWWKKRTGWLDLGRTITITGTILAKEPPDIDGDRNFDVKLDAGQDRWITGFGGRLTSHPDSGPARRPSIHCEIPPWSAAELKAAYDVLKVGDRVMVTGAWGFDGVHTNQRWFVLEVLLALMRHQPNVQDGWFEIHPVTSLVTL